MTGVSIHQRQDTSGMSGGAAVIELATIWRMLLQSGCIQPLHGPRCVFLCQTSPTFLKAASSVLWRRRRAFSSFRRASSGSGPGASCAKVMSRLGGSTIPVYMEVI